MKILQVIDSLNIGGAENLVANFLLQHKFHDSFLKSNNNTSLDKHNEGDIYELCVLFDADSFLKTKLEENKITIYSLHLKSKYDIQGVFRLVKLVNSNRYDVVHVHLFPALYYCALASIFTRNTKYIYTEHSTFNRRRSKKIFAILDNQAYRRYKKIITICRQAKSELAKHLNYLNDKTVVIYNGIQINSPIVRDKIYDILLVGSLREAKGVDVFIKAIKLLEDSVNVVAIAGDGSLKAELISLRNMMGLQDKIIFLGTRSDIGTLLEQSRMFVLSSRWEGVPISLLEAMSKEKPIVCTRVGGIPEIITDDTGILVDCKEEELASAMRMLLNDDALAKKLGRSAYERVKEQFSLEKYTNEVEHVYHTI